MSWELEIGEAEANGSFWEAVPADVAAEYGVRTRRLGEGFCCAVAALPGARLFNRVVGLQSVDEGVLEETDRFFEDTQYFISLAPQAGGGELLRSRGFEEDYAWMRFRRGVEALETRDTELRIAEVDQGAATDWAGVVLAAYGMPGWMGRWLAALPGRAGWSCWGAFEGDRAVGAGALYVHDHIGWLGFAGTREEARGRGAQSGILAARIARAGESGCTVIATETGVRTGDRPSNSYRNILRAGFEEAYARPNWRCPRRDSNPQPRA